MLQYTFARTACDLLTYGFELTTNWIACHHIQLYTKEHHCIAGLRWIRRCRWLAASILPQRQSEDSPYIILNIVSLTTRDLPRMAFSFSTNKQTQPLADNLCLFTILQCLVSITMPSYFFSMPKALLTSPCSSSITAVLSADSSCGLAAPMAGSASIRDSPWVDCTGWGWCTATQPTDRNSSRAVCMASRHPQTSCWCQAGMHVFMPHVQ